MTRIVLPAQNIKMDVPTGVDPVWYEKLKLIETQLNSGAASLAANLPAAGVAGRRAFVTDATVATFASIVAGGGSNGVPVYDDGTNWRIG